MYSKYDSAYRYATIVTIKDKYKPGTRVKLVRMNDLQAPPIGTKGTVEFVDDIGTIHVNWDNGFSLGVVLDEDKCVICNE